MLSLKPKKGLPWGMKYVLVLFQDTNNRFPRRNQSMTNKAFIKELLSLFIVFIAAYAFMVVA